MKYYLEAEKNFFETVGLPYPYERPLPSLAEEIDDTKILVFADIHEPFALDKEIRDTVMKHKDARRCVVVGDIGDFYSKSRFRKNYKGDFYQEIREIFFRMEFFSTHFTEVNILIGNHDNRPQKRIRELLSPEIDLIILSENDLIKKLSSYFPNVNIVGHKVIGEEIIEVTHLWQLGDIVFTHGELSRKQSTAILERISDFLKKWKKELGLKDYRAIIQGHNHRALKTVIGDELQMIVPCSMETRSKGGEYIYSPRMIGDPPAQGYAIIYQEKGRTDFNRSNFYLY